MKRLHRAVWAAGLTGFFTGVSSRSSVAGDTVTWFVCLCLGMILGILTGIATAEAE